MQVGVIYLFVTDTVTCCIRIVVQYEVFSVKTGISTFWKYVIINISKMVLGIHFWVNDDFEFRRNW
jgi:hypothetical protein